MLLVSRTAPEYFLNFTKTGCFTLIGKTFLEQAKISLSMYCKTGSGNRNIAIVALRISVNMLLPVHFCPMCVWFIIIIIMMDISGTPLKIIFCYPESTGVGGDMLSKVHIHLINDLYKSKLHY